jgi:hypothetical protein
VCRPRHRVTRCERPADQDSERWCGRIWLKAQDLKLSLLDSRFGCDLPHNAGEIPAVP